MSIRYDALAVKARAMYGRRTRKEDLVRINKLTTIDAIAEELRALPGWSEATASLPEGELLTRARLESALRNQVRREALRLGAYAAREDRPFLEFPVRRTELEMILSALRRLHANMHKADDALSPAWLHRTQVDPDALRTCTDFAGLVEGARRSIYYSALCRLLSEDGSTPDYGSTEALLWSVYFKHLMELACKRYRGDVRKMMESSVGTQMDMMNILHALRLKRFFPDTDNFLPVLVPYHYRVKPEQIHAMCTAPSLEAAMELIDNTPYAAIFRDAKVEQLQDLYHATLYKTCRRQLVMGKPTIYSAVAYLNLRELELKAVVTAVEASKYRIPLTQSFLDTFED
jgi:hypothetical protein